MSFLNCKMLVDNKPPISFFFLAVVLLFLITRLVNLTILPIFNDEAIYISWAKIIGEGLENVLIPVQVESKKPLFMWLTAVLLKIFKDPLWAGRFVSVTAGFFSLVGIFLLGRKIHSESAGCIAALFYVVCPYYVFFDRMAHQDALLNCFFIWLLFLSLVIFQEKEKYRNRHFWALGFIIGLNLLTKSTAILYVFLPFLLKLILFSKSNSVPWKKLSASYLLGLIVGIIPYAALFFTFTNISLKDIFIPTQTSLSQTSVMDSLLKIPQNIYFNFGSPVEYFITYLTWPVFCLATLFFVFQHRVFNKNYFILLIYFVIPFFLVLGIGGIGFSRYFLFCGTPILLWAAIAFYYAVDFLKQRRRHKFSYIANVFIILIFFYPAIVFNYTLLTKPSEAPFIDRDYNQYISSQFSGYGIPKALDYFKKVSGENKITIFTDSNWGNPADAIYVYLSDNPNINVYTAFWVFQSNLLPAGTQKIKTFQQYTRKEINPIDVSGLGKIYFICNSSVFKKSWFLRVNNNFRLVGSFGKPNSTDFVDIYKRI